MGRLITIDWGQVDSWLEAHADGTEVALALGIHYDTLANACVREKELSFSDYKAQKRAKGLVSLRQSQFKTADGGNSTMQIYLGKQYLGQSDNPKVDNEVSEAIRFTRDPKQADDYREFKEQDDQEAP